MLTRIMTGSLKRRTLLLPAGDVRPTREMVRKAMFDVLAGVFDGITVLDLFAGSGALGLEALSAGCRAVTFVEKQPMCCRVIRENARRLQVERQCRIVSGDAVRVMADLSRQRETFGVVFADPPYAGDEAKKCLLALGACDIVSAPGLVVLEHHKSVALAPRCGSLILWQTKHYGDTNVSFYIYDAGQKTSPEEEIGEHA